MYQLSPDLPDKQDHNTQIVNFLAYSPIVYGFIILVGELIIQPIPVEENNFLYNLPYIFAIVLLVDVSLIEKYFMPYILNSTNKNRLYRGSIYTLLITNTIGIYGLIIGLVDIFILGITPRWPLVTSFLLVSIMYAYYIKQTKIIPRLSYLN